MSRFRVAATQTPLDSCAHCSRNSSDDSAARSVSKLIVHKRYKTKVKTSQKSQSLCKTPFHIIVPHSDSYPQFVPLKYFWS